MREALLNRRPWRQWPHRDAENITTPGLGHHFCRAFRKAPEPTPDARGRASLQQNPATRIDQDQHGGLARRARAACRAARETQGIPHCIPQATGLQWTRPAIWSSPCAHQGAHIHHRLVEICRPATLPGQHKISPIPQNVLGRFAGRIPGHGEITRQYTTHVAIKHGVTLLIGNGSGHEHRLTMVDACHQIVYTLTPSAAT